MHIIIHALFIYCYITAHAIVLTFIYQRSNLKRRCKIHSTLRPSNHNSRNVRLHFKTKEINTLSPTTAQFTTEKQS